MFLVRLLEDDCLIEVCYLADCHSIPLVVMFLLFFGGELILTRVLSTERPSSIFRAEQEETNIKIKQARHTKLKTSAGIHNMSLDNLTNSCKLGCLNYKS